VQISTLYLIRNQFDVIDKKSNLAGSSCLIACNCTFVKEKYYGDIKIDTLIGTVLEFM
jgi:hypothetical protein